MKNNYIIEKTTKFIHNNENRFNVVNALTSKFLHEGNGFFDDNYNCLKSNSNVIEVWYNLNIKFNKKTFRIPFIESLIDAKIQLKDLNIFDE